MADGRPAADARAHTGPQTPGVEEVALAPGVGGWFTDATAGNLAHRRPHLPSRLARNREAVAAHIGVPVASWHLMRQVHGAEVARVTDSTPAGAELEGVDALITAMVGRALVVQVADCVPVLLASTRGPVAVVHAGRRGLVSGVLNATLDHLEDGGAPARSVRAAIGPAVGACCYEVSEELQAEVSAEHPVARAATSWGTPSLDLAAAVRTVLDSAGVRIAVEWPGCTACGGRWFSHRADPAAGRQIGVVARLEPADHTRPATADGRAARNGQAEPGARDHVGPAQHRGEADSRPGSNSA